METARATSAKIRATRAVMASICSVNNVWYSSSRGSSGRCMSDAANPTSSTAASVTVTKLARA